MVVIVVIHILCECYKCFCKYLVYNNIFMWMMLQNIIIFSEAYLWLMYSIIWRLRVFPLPSGNENQGRHKSEKIGRGVCKILLLLNQVFSVASHIFVDMSSLTMEQIYTHIYPMYGNEMLLNLNIIIFGLFILTISAVISLPVV